MINSTFASRSRLEATCRLPLIVVTADRIKAKERLHCIHARVMLYSDFRFVANNSGSRLYAMVISSLSTSCRENRCCEYCILHFLYPLSIFPLRCILLLPVECWDLCGSVARCVWVKVSNVKKCFLLPITCRNTLLLYLPLLSLVYWLILVVLSRL